MKADETKLYTSADDYFKGPDGMKNEVTMWFVATGLMIQQLSIQNGNKPFGGLGFAKGQVKDYVDVLDVCSGPGNFVNHLQLALPNLTVTCVDLNKAFVDAGRKLFGQWEWVVNDVVEMDLGKQFDVVTASSAFHHIADERKEKFWRNMMRHLKPSGFILVCENFLPDYSDAKERKGAVDTYYSELKSYFREGNATAESQGAIEEVHQLEKSGVEEHKVSFRMFSEQIGSLGIRIFQDIVVWQPESFRDDNAGSHVLVLK